MIQKAAQFVNETPAAVNASVMLGSLLLSFLQPIAVVVTIVWGCLQIHGYVEKRWGWSWLTRIFRKR